MRSLKLLCIAAVVTLSAMIATTPRDTAMANSAAVTNYKQAVTKRVDAWSARFVTGKAITPLLPMK